MTDEQLEYELKNGAEQFSYRSKKWFKELSDDRKREICEKFEITEDVLKKAGCKDKYGNIHINILKLEYPNPEIWKKFLEICRLEKTSSIISNLKQSTSIKDIVWNLNRLLNMYNSAYKFREYNGKYDCHVVDLKKRILYCWNFIEDIDEQESVKENYANTILSHLKIGLKDLKIIK